MAKTREYESFEGIAKAFEEIIPKPAKLFAVAQQSLFEGMTGVKKDIQKGAHRWKNQSGELSKSHYVKKEGDKVVILGASAEHASYLQLGTGIYGVKKRPIVPKKANVLSFVIDGSRVFATSVKGIDPAKYKDWIPDAYFKKEKRIFEKINKDIVDKGFDL